MKQVWILNHYATDPSVAGGTRHFHLAEKLSSFGWQATIIAASEYNRGTQRLTYGERRRMEIKSGVSFLWIRTPAYQGNGLGRMLNMLFYTFRVLLPGYTKGLPTPDVIIGSSVHPFAALAGSLLARRYRIPFIFEVRDLWPQTLIDMGHIKERSFLTRSLRRLEQWLYRRASHIVTLLPRAVDYITALGIPADKVAWIPNGVDLDAFPAPSPRLRRDGDPFVLMYFGAHGQANGLDIIIRAMKLVAEQVSPGAISLRMIGDGPLKSDLIRFAEALALRDISFETPIPKKDIPVLAVEADAFIITVLDLPRLYRYGISMNKLFDYFAAARPIIIASSAINNPVEESGGGITVPPNNPESLAQAILEVSRMSTDDRYRMGNAGRCYVAKNHSYNKLAGRLAGIMDSCLDKSCGSLSLVDKR